MKKKLVIIVLVVLIILGIIYISKNNKDDIPVLNIDLNNITLEKINNNSKTIKYPDNSLKLTYGDETFNDNIVIKGRGNSTWLWPKKPYQITLSKKTNLLNLGTSSKWVLLANYIDETLIRNHMAFYIANMLDMEYVSLGSNIHLYIDDQYQGIYYLLPKVEISQASVNLKNNDGVLVELDNVYYYDEDDTVITNRFKDHLVLKDVKDESLKEKAYNNFIEKYSQLEVAVANHNWDKILELVDIESLAKHNIVYELSRNNDAYRSSFYMYMDGENDKIHFGPVWDFDRAFGNTNHGPNQTKTIENDAFSDETYNKYSEMFFELVQFDEFKSVIKEVWNKYMLDGLDKIQKEINANYQLLEKEAKRNNRKWQYSRKYKDYVNDLSKTIDTIYSSYRGVVENIY